MFLPILAAGNAMKAEAAAAAAARAANESTSSTRQLEREVNRLLMITEALWEIIQEREGLSDEHLVAKIDEIDFRDGALDGRLAKTPPTKCSACNRTLPKRQPVCIYCGLEADLRDPFAR